MKYFATPKIMQKRQPATGREGKKTDQRRNYTHKNASNQSAVKIEKRMNERKGKNAKTLRKNRRRLRNVRERRIVSSKQQNANYQ